MVHSLIVEFYTSGAKECDTMTQSTKLKYLTQETSYTLKSGSLQQKYQKSNPESRKEKES